MSGRGSLASVVFVRAGLPIVVGAVLAVLGAMLDGAARANVGPTLSAETRAVAPDAANLWVDGTAGACTRSQAPARYRGASACASIDAAWDACRPGDVIRVRAGTYAAQAITGDKAAPGCTVVGDSGTTIGELTTEGRFLALQNVTVDVGPAKRAGWAARASNVTLTNVAFHGPFVSIDISGVSNVRWSGGELGSPNATGGRRICGQDAEPLQIAGADHVTIDRVRFHPQDADPTPSPCSANGFHLEMIRLDAGTTFFTLSNSTFDNGDHSGTASVFITEPGGSVDPHDLTFENNFFGTNDSVGAFDVHSNVTSCVNFTFAYNTFRAPTGAFQCTSAVNTVWVGNLGANGPAASCFGTFINNVWQDTHSDKCGSDTWVFGARGRVDRLGLGGPDGFHLQPGSPAIDAGERTGYCTSKLGARDHDGRRRPIGGRCDAGATELCGLDDLVERRLCTRLAQVSVVRR